jgi:hypothetical protein
MSTPGDSTALQKSVWHLIRDVLSCVWGRVRWKMLLIIAFTGTSTILVACLGVAALNVVVRREGANVVEKQIQVLVQASRSVPPAILGQALPCTAQPTNSAGLQPLLAYTDEEFPQAQTSLTVEDSRGVQSLLKERKPDGLKNPVWLPAAGFAGLVADQGQIEIRNIVVQQSGACKATAAFSLPVGSELAKRLSSAAGLEVTAVAPTLFSVHSSNVFRTLERNFVPGISRHAAVVLTVRNWNTGAIEDWTVYNVRASYSGALEDVVRFGSQLANWVWLLTVLSIAIFLMDAWGVWMLLRFGGDIATTIDDLSKASHQIAGGNFAWRTPVHSKGQVGDLMGDINEMAIALERLQKDEAARLKIESELQVARSVQEYLYPREAPQMQGATVSGRTSAARTIGGDLYDYFQLSPERIGILCADVSGKGIPAALMMANLQAIARAQLGGRRDDQSDGPAHFVEILNRQLAGRFGDNRYATLVWVEYSAQNGMLTYINAGHPAPILIDAAGGMERLDSDGFPLGMFVNAQYRKSGNISIQPEV